MTSARGAPPSADDARGVGGDDLTAQLERVRNRLRRGRRRALGLAPPSERPFASRARDDPRAPLSGRLVPEPRQVEELEGIVVGGLVALRPAHRDAVAGPAGDIVRAQRVLDHPYPEAVSGLGVDRLDARAPHALAVEELDRQPIAVLARGEGLGYWARDRRPQLAAPIDPLAGDLVAHVDEVRARGAEVLGGVPAGRPDSCVLTAGEDRQASKREADAPGEEPRADRLSHTTQPARSARRPSAPPHSPHSGSSASKSAPAPARPAPALAAGRCCRKAEACRHSSPRLRAAAAARWR